MLTSTRSRGSSLTKRAERRVNQRVEKRSRRVVKSQRARQRRPRLLRTQVKRTEVEHLVPHLLFQRIMVSVVMQGLVFTLVIHLYLKCLLRLIVCILIFRYFQV